MQGVSSPDPVADPILAQVAARYGMSMSEAQSILPPDTPEIRSFCSRWSLSPALLWGLLVAARKLNLGFGFQFIGQGREAQLGPLSFEDEAGYLRGMLNGFAFMLTTLERPVDAALLCALHDVSIRGVRRRNGRPFQQGFARRPWKYGFLWNVEGMLPEFHSISRAAWKELFDERIVYIPYRSWVDEQALDLHITGERQSFLVRMGRMRKPPQFCLAPLWKARGGPAFQAEIQQRIQDALTTHRNARAQAGIDRGAHLAAIARLCRTLELLHTFPDGNGRTIYGLLLQKLLLEGGYGPVILDTPCTFDGYFCTAEMVGLIEAGFGRFEQFKWAFVEDSG